MNNSFKPTFLLFFQTTNIVIIVLLAISGCSHFKQNDFSKPADRIHAKQLLEKTKYVEIHSKSFHGKFNRDDAEFEWVRRLLACVERVEQLPTYRLPEGHKIAAENNLYLFDSDEPNASPICMILHYEPERVLEVFIHKTVGYRVPIALNEEMGNAWTKIRNDENNPARDEVKD